MSKLISKSLFHLKTIYLFTASDIHTIILPATFFGLVVALSGSLFTSKALLMSRVAIGLPQLLFWEYVNLLAFNTSNQSQPNAIVEDTLNKPFRAIPSGRISAADSTKLFYFVQSICFVTAYFWTGGFHPSIVLAHLSWLFNVLHLGEKGIVIRYLLNAAGYICFFAGGAEALFGSKNFLNERFWAWCAMLGLVIFTTVHAQDFQDQEGDRESGKMTIPLMLGDGSAGKISVAVPVLAWSIFLPWALGTSVERGASVFGYLLTAIFGLIVCWKVHNGKDQVTWRSMYKWYNVWLMALVALPLAVVYQSVGWM